MLQFKLGKKKEKQFLWMLPLFFIFIISIVNAAPPQAAQPEFGFDVRSGVADSIQQGQDYDFHVHVFNSSNGVPITTGISCYLHLYKGNGNHLFEGVDTVASHIFDYGFYVSGGNFTNLGECEYIIQCNSSSEGGFFASNFQVTESGNEGTDTTWIIVIALILAFALMMYGFAREEHPPITMAGILFMVIALYLWVNGIGVLGATELIPRILAASLFVVGAVLSIKSLSELK